MLNESKSRFSGKIAIATNNLKTVTGHIGNAKHLSFMRLRMTKY